MHIRTCISCVIVAVSMATHLAKAGEVALPYKGLTLNANLELAAGKTPADGVILITHGGLLHNGMEAIAYFRELPKDKG